MKITQDVREYARTHGLEATQALEAGMEEMAEEFVKGGAKVYHKL
jgi:phosphomethylpyrimidine synthase